GLAVEARVPVLMHPFEMHRITRVLLALEPVAGNVGDHDLAEAVLPGERLPDRQLGRRLRPHIGEQEPGAFLHRIGLGGAALAAAGIDDVIIGLLDDAAGLVHQPAVIIAADAGLLDYAVREVGAPMRAVPVDEAVAPAQVLVEDEILAHQPDGLDRVCVELARATDWHPVASQIVAHRRAGADLGEDLVLFSAEHCRALLQLSSPVGTFLFSLCSFMPEASAMVSIRAAKSFCRYSSGLGLSVAAPKWLCNTSRAAAVTGIGTSHSRPRPRPRSMSLRRSSGVNVVVQSRLTSAGDL